MTNPRGLKRPVKGRPLVAIVGRQNVGKSTLLNRLAGKRLAITEDIPGTTRDWLATDVIWEGTEFTIVDTGGLELSPVSSVTREVRNQVEEAIFEADTIIFLVSVMDGIVPTELEIANILRKANKPVILVTNKADNERLEYGSVEFYELGMGSPIPISAHHGRGIDSLLSKVISLLPPSMSTELEEGIIKVAIVGRPNVGKSTLLNTMLGWERAIVDEIPGTTRDALDTLVDFGDRSMLLIDTAGVRRRGRIKPGVERFSVLRSLRAIERSDVSLLVFDATEPLTAQDLHIIGYIKQSMKGMIIIGNKWDLVSTESAKEFIAYAQRQLRFVPYAPLLWISAKYSEGVDKILPQICLINDERAKRLPTTKVNSFVERSVTSHPLPRSGHKQLKIFYATQAGINPPTFVFFVNDTELVHFSYKRYLENKLRQYFGFGGTPLNLIFRNRE